MIQMILMLLLLHEDIKVVVKKLMEEFVVAHELTNILPIKKKTMTFAEI